MNIRRILLPLLATLFLFLTTLGAIGWCRSSQQQHNQQLVQSIQYFKHTTAKLHRSNKFGHSLAYKQSLGFFNDISDVDWMRLRKRHQETPNCGPLQCAPEPAHKWFQNNFEPTFTCLHERRIGGLGDGPKWVCDPHRIDPSNCLVYSIGSNNKFEFELSVLNEISSTCEIHTFDPTLSKDVLTKEGLPSNKPRNGNVHFHPWGLADHDYVHVQADTGKKMVYKTMGSIVSALGHQKRRIDLMKVDCEGCEYSTVDGWFGVGVNIGQILVELHGGTNLRPKITSFDWFFFRGSSNAKENTQKVDERGVAKTFLETLQKNGYVTFHKEPNTIAGGSCIEYALVKMSKEFFDKDPFHEKKEEEMEEEVSHVLRRKEDVHFH